MKRVLILALGLCLGTATVSLAQNAAKAATAAPAAAPASLSWKKLVYDFGEIPQNVPATAEFEFTNTTKAPVILTDVKGSCGCTVPAWPKEPIAPGKSNKISATYNAAAVGPFTKTVTVTTNKDSAPIVLTIQGKVVEKK